MSIAVFYHLRSMESKYRENTFRETEHCRFETDDDVGHTQMACIPSYST